MIIFTISVTASLTPNWQNKKSKLCREDQWNPPKHDDCIMYSDCFFKCKYIIVYIFYWYTHYIYIFYLPIIFYDFKAFHICLDSLTWGHFASSYRCRNVTWWMVTAMACAAFYSYFWKLQFDPGAPSRRGFEFGSKNYEEDGGCGWWWWLLLLLLWWWWW